MRKMLLICALLFLPSLAHADTCANANKTGTGFPCSVTLNWVDNSGAANDQEDTFNIDRNLNGGAWSNVGFVKTNITTFVDNTLQQSQTVDNNYCFRVIAANKAGSAAPSNTACFVVLKPIKPPAPVTSLTISFSTATGEVQIGSNKYPVNGEPLTITVQADKGTSTMTSMMQTSQRVAAPKALRKK